MANVVWTTAAGYRLNEIIDSLRRNVSAATANNVHRDLADAADSLEMFPGRYKVDEDGIRRMPTRKEFTIEYMVEDDTVYIVNVAVARLRY